MDKLIELQPEFWEAAGETLYMVSLTLLFGYRGGSFTGARKEGMQGKLQQADGGTLFLDAVAACKPF